MYFGLTFEIAPQYYAHLALYIFEYNILELIVSLLNAQPNEMRAKSVFDSLLRWKTHERVYCREDLAYTRRMVV